MYGDNIHNFEGGIQVSYNSTSKLNHLFISKDWNKIIALLIAFGQKVQFEKDEVEAEAKEIVKKEEKSGKTK